MCRMPTRPRVLDWLDGANTVRAGQRRVDAQECRLRAVPSLDVSERDGRLVVHALLGGLLLPSWKQPRPSTNVHAGDVRQRVGRDGLASVFRLPGWLRMCRWCGAADGVRAWQLRSERT